MFSAAKSPYLVPFDDSFQVAHCLSTPLEDAPDKKKCKKRLEKLVEELSELQRMLYADNRYAVLLVFQAMDAAGKDSTIRAVLTGVNPAGCQVSSFKKPSSLELDHDFLWRTTCRLPERGTIGVFNRSYYEEVLVVRVHPELLEYQRLPDNILPSSFWDQRFSSIRNQEEHLARNGVLIMKFWLNVSKNEQKKRFLSRIEEAEKNWKFSKADVDERSYWNDYMEAYQETLRMTSRPWAPWYAIPADNKPYMRYRVAEIVVENLRSLNLRYPEVGAAERLILEEMRSALRDDD